MSMSSMQVAFRTGVSQGKGRDISDLNAMNPPPDDWRRNKMVKIEANPSEK